jgi:hypothetical protein
VGPDSVLIGSLPAKAPFENRSRHAPRAVRQFILCGLMALGHRFKPAAGT